MTKNCSASNNSKSYKEYKKIKDDLLIFKRQESENYYYRINTNSTPTYIIKSSRTKSKKNAIEIARQAYYSFKNDKENENIGLQIAIESRLSKKLSFMKLWKEWIDEIKKYETKSQYTIKVINGNAEKYFLRYFGDYKITEIDKNLIKKYWDWRMDYWSKYKDEREKEIGSTIYYYKHKPSYNTLKIEKNQLKEFFSWCHDNDKIHKIPIIKNPLKKNQNVRPCFTGSEYEEFVQFLQKWEKKKNLTKTQIYQRKMLNLIVQFLACSGLRPNEARQLKWNNIETMKIDGSKFIIIKVPNDTKTGKRECLPFKYLEKIFKKIKRITKKSDQNDYLFCKYDGKKYNDFPMKTLKKALKESGLLYDSNNKERTFYSFRHTYATEAIRNNIPIDKLAKNMGTSMEMISEHYNHMTVQDDYECLTSYNYHYDNIA